MTAGNGATSIKPMIPATVIHMQAIMHEDASVKAARTRSMLDRDIKSMEKGKLSSMEFRRAWAPHFSSPEHMSVCTCYGICPFR